MNITKWVLVITAYFTLVVFSPFGILWAINHLVTSLFVIAAPIPYNFWSWLAIVVMNITWMRKNNLKLKY